jgi:hypothetical protein
MPLKCLSPNGQEYAFRHSGESWAELKAANAVKKHLRMSCCAAQVVLKRSNRGTQFFAHARRGPCTTAPESAEHLLAKDIIARAAEASGWTATTEESGTSPSGKVWIADVLCRKAGLKVSIAIEVQWSSQNAEETEARQEIYKECGVRGIWLMRQPVIPIGKSTPAFQLQLKSKAESPLVRLPSPDYIEIQVNKNTQADPRNWAQCIPLDEFVRGALTGRLRFAPALHAAVPIRVHAAEGACWKCSKPTMRLLRVEFAVDELFPSHGNYSMNREDIETATPQSETWLAKYLPKELLASAGIGEIKKRYSRTVGSSYLSNGCVHCDALQGAFFDHEVVSEANPVLTAHAVIEPWVTNAVGGARFVNRWWFDRCHAPEGF